MPPDKPHTILAIPGPMHSRLLLPCVSVISSINVSVISDSINPTAARTAANGKMIHNVAKLTGGYQGALIDGDGMTIAGQALESLRVSFFIPLVCFFVIAIFGFAVYLFPGKSETAQR